ncbi:MAG TPA: protein kinase [Kofleriaceae bacterium]|jgi:serine/threonine-protein kinase|nr:protein kinase [Kofleriaceae bacterium]
MTDRLEVEIRIVVTEGILSREQASALRQEALQTGQSPLALLVARGRLSDESLRSLLAMAFDDTAMGGADPTPVTAIDPPPRAGTDEAPRFPVAGWERYASVRFLGQGGMGKVFLAVDPRLHREVAIKFVHGDNPEHVRRLIAEARAQARVSHERVCKIHEVGEVEGRVYIAMQYIAGQPLGALAGELSLEQKVMLVRGAADGLHEAHRVGIIHRDIKPSNIMVARGDDGALRPYVMDFGLARSVLEDNATLSGAVLGTPRYMAPEQAGGRTGTLDRRADIYSLGATLYHLLTGEPPIPGTTLLEVMHHLQTTEPRAPRALDPDIPVDLEAIVMKCLEKDRSARYDSARALADDLGRFLDGEPVLARPAGVWYRTRKRLAKHRRLVAAGGAALVALAVALGWGIQTRREASERERLARRFTEQVEHVEAMARYSALSPLHDIRGDQAAIRAQMAELEREIRTAGAVAAGPGEYALGRGDLALDDDAGARAHLASAWRHGFREPRVAYALALALGHLYRQNLLAAQHIEQTDLRAARTREVEQQYRDPALGYLAQSQGAEVPSPEYVAALVAFYEGHLDQALGHLDAIGGALPWFYEAPELRGDILLARALSLRDQGDRDRARRDFEAGREAYAAAGAVGESVPAVSESLGELEYAAMVMELYGRGEVTPPFDRTLAATTRALAIMPELYAALVLEARAYRSMAEHQASQGTDLEALLTKAIAAAERAVAIAPGQVQARLELARIYRQWGEARQSKTQDPSEQMRKAVEISEAITPADRDGAYYGNLGQLFSVWGSYQDQVGEDAEANRSKSIEAFTRALQINDKMNDVWINLGINYYKRASQPRAKDADRDLTQALRALDRARSINPKHVVPYFYAGEIHTLIAERARLRGIDADPELVRALEVYEAGLAINPKLPHLHNGIGQVRIDQAKQAWDRGADPEPWLDQARAAFAQAIAVAPDQGFGYNNLGDLLALRARWQRARGEDPSANVQASVAALNQAIQRIPDNAEFWANLGMAHAISAAYELDHGRDPQASLAEASSAIDQALAKNPNDALAQHYLGETRGLRARLHALHRQDGAADFAEAARAFQRSIELAPEDLDHQLGFGELCRAWAALQQDARQDPDPTLQRGLALANQLLATHPTWPDARILRASLLVIQLQRLPDVAQQREQAARAAEDFTRALAVNPALDNVWKIQAALAQRLAAPRP